MRNVILKMVEYVYHPFCQRLCKCLLALALLIVASHAFADGTDFLQGTDQSAWATFNGTGKKYLYLGEGLLALFTYIKTKNVLALIGIVVVAIFINIILKMAGQS